MIRLKKNPNNIISIKEYDDEYRIIIKFRRIKYFIERGSILHLNEGINKILIKVLSCNLDDKTIIAKKFKPCIYVWTTESLKLTNAYKVGLVNWQSVKNRLKQTDTTGIIEEIELVDIFELNILDHRITERVESEIHDRIGKIRKNREGVRGDYKTVVKPTILNVIEEFKLKKILTFDIKSPRYYQQDAADIAIDYYKTNDRGWIQWTCGSGKSFGSYWIYKSVMNSIKITNNIVIILVPNRQLVVQTHDDWVSYATSYGNKVRSIKLGGVDGSIDDEGKIARWLENSTKDEINLIVSTYQSSGKISFCLKYLNIEAEFVINDEVHRLTGSNDKSWQKCLLDSEMPSKKRLSMTASPIEYTLQSLGFSGLENEKLFGKRFHKYLFLDAQFDGYISPLEILGIEADESIIEFVKNIINKNKNIIQKNLYNCDNIDVSSIDEDIDLAKGNPSFFVQLHNTLVSLRDGIFTHPIIYTNSIKRIKMFMACLISMADDYDVNIDYYDIFTADDNIKHRIKKLENDFSKSKIGVVGNVYCLQEGVSIDVVDGIVMIDPRSSGPAITQIIGRPVRLNSKNVDKVAKILLPIILKKEDEKYIVDKTYFSTTRDWMLNVCGSDDDFNNLFIENISIFSDKSREGIDVKNILPVKSKKSISGISRNLDKKQAIVDVLDFDDLKEQLKIGSFISTKKTNLKRRCSEFGIEEKLKREALTYVIDLKNKIETYILNFDNKKVKKYSEIIKNKEEYISNFAQFNKIDIEKSKELLDNCNIDNVIDLSEKLKNMNIKSVIKSLKSSLK